MANLAAERAAVDSILAGFTAAPVLWPDSTIKPPTPSADPAVPVSYVAAEIEYGAAEPTDFAGGTQTDGAVMLDVWTQRGRGDALLRQLLDSLVSLFAAANTSDIFFLRPEPGAAQVDGADWYGRSLRVPFVRFS